MRRTVIGIEFGASQAHAACAVASFVAGRTAISELTECSAGDDPVAVVAEWMAASADPILLALDAPLGWPAPLGKMLSEHRAGEAPTAEATALFARATDRIVGERLGQAPLEWISGRMAAFAGVAFLDDVRTRTDAEISLAWTSELDAAAAIEVLPAATLRAHRLPSSGHEDAGDTDHRYNIAVALRDRIGLPRDMGAMVASPDMLSAVVCVLAAHDFLTGQASNPGDEELARREGWIWVRDPGRGTTGL